MRRYLILLLVLSTSVAVSQPSDRQRLFEAAANGEMHKLGMLMGAGISPNLKDDRGDTPLHLAVSRGHQATAELLLSLGAHLNATNRAGLTPLDVARSGGHTATAEFLAARGAVSAFPRAKAVGPGGTRAFHPDAPFTTAEAFSRAIGRPAVMLDSPHVSILAPKDREPAAAIVLPYLVRAYDELHKIVGVHTQHKLLVYAYPKGTPGIRGGTAGCVINYTDENLDLASQAEWLQHRVPHVSGYIEEMAHNFVHATGAEFGWEMLGWSLGVKVCDLVASNPVYRRHVEETRHGQDQTWQRYVAAGRTFPADLPGDQADRLHAFLLRRCEQQYGPRFWLDFFAEVRKMRAAFGAPEARGESAGLNTRYRLTVECFDRLPGLHFKQVLEQNGISDSVAVQSLKPTDLSWNRKLR